MSKHSLTGPKKCCLQRQIPLVSSLKLVLNDDRTEDDTGDSAKVWRAGGFARIEAVYLGREIPLVFRLDFLL